MHGAPLQKPRILVVDDEVDISDFICQAAEKQGYQAEALNDPTKFGQICNQEFNLIFLDLHMPEVDGIELIRYLGEIKSQASLVISSGTDSTILHSAKELAMAHGLYVLGVLEKPVRLKELAQIFRQFSRPKLRHEILQGNDEFPSTDDLEQVIRNQGLSLACQPQIDMQTRALTGVEMLVRWNHPVRGAVEPSLFVPLAENSGLIDDLTKFVISASLRQVGEWRKAGIDTRVSINMSPLNLTDIELPEKLANMAKKNNVDPASVVIEVTENALTENIAKFLDILTRLRLKGFMLSIDDFGSGYSTMVQLLRAPFNELKIDRAFVKEIQFEKESRVIVSSSIKMAHDLGLRVVAEGIETDKDWNFLQENGCDEGQGYWMARPMPISQLAGWIEEGAF